MSKHWKEPYTEEAANAVGIHGHEMKEMLDSMIGHDFEEPKWWRRGWIPFLANGGGDHLCIDMMAEDGGTVGQVLKYWHDDEDRDIEYSSFVEWLQALVESMEDGILELN